MRWRLIALSILLVATAGAFFTMKMPSATKAVNGRDATTWPFAATSIWNTPIGSGAAYVPTSASGPIVVQGVTPDPVYFVQTSSSDPKVPLYQAGWAGKRCASTTPVGFDPIVMPNDFVLPDDSHPGYTPNNASAILQPDGRSLIQIEPLARCKAGGPAYGWLACGWGHTEDIEGEGICGAHFGSSLSSIGGMLRKGELTGSGPIHHALSIEFWMRMYGYYSASSPNHGHRWPALAEDAYAPTTDGYCSLDPCHSKPNPSFTEGALLAIPPAVDLNSLHLQTDAAKKVFTALQNYGGYQVDDTGWNVGQISIEKSALDEFQQSYGYPFGAGAFGDDVKEIIQKLQIVDNNGPDSIGGGGATRRAPWAPAFADGTGGPPAGAQNPDPTVQPTSQPTTVPAVTPTPAATSTPAPTPTVTPSPTPAPHGAADRNNKGVSNTSQPSMADYDGWGNSYSAQALQAEGIAAGKTITFNGVAFAWPDVAVGTEDNYQTNNMLHHKHGVVIDVPGTNSATAQTGSNVGGITLSVSPVNGATTLAFLGSSTNGPSVGAVTVTYTDGTQQKVLLGFSDWTLNGGHAKVAQGNRVVAKMPYRNAAKSNDGRKVVATYLFYNQIALLAGKTVQSVTLPTVVNQGHFHVFAVGTK